MSEKNDKGKHIDYIFARYPLWIRYSGLPQKLGPIAWSVFQRLLELHERFKRVEFEYALERLCETTGIISRQGMRKVLKRLEDEELIECKTEHGRGKKAKIKILMPIKTPVSEEEIYRTQPRLRPRSYRNEDKGNGVNVLGEEKKVNSINVLEDKNVNNVNVLGGKNVIGVNVLEREKVNSVNVLSNSVNVLGKSDELNNTITAPKESGQKKPHDKDKNDLYKKDNNNKKDLFHEKEKNTTKDKDEDTPPVTPIQETDESDVVVAVDINSLKEYGISGGDAEKFLKKYSQDYLREKIEVIEFKRSNGEEIRNIGGMLKKAIIGDWQPPPGFTTRAQREEDARKKREAEELALQEAKAKEERELIQRDQAKIAEEWKQGATREELDRINERARREILAENPGQNERWLRPLVRMREERIIAEEYAAGTHRVRRGS